MQRPPPSTAHAAANPSASFDARRGRLRRRCGDTGRRCRPRRRMRRRGARSASSSPIHCFGSFRAFGGPTIAQRAPFGNIGRHCQRQLQEMLCLGFQARVVRFARDAARRPAAAFSMSRAWMLFGSSRRTSSNRATALLVRRLRDEAVVHQLLRFVQQARDVADPLLLRAELRFQFADRGVGKTDLRGARAQRANAFDLTRRQQFGRARQQFGDDLGQALCRDRIVRIGCEHAVVDLRRVGAGRIDQRAVRAICRCLLQQRLDFLMRRRRLLHLVAHVGDFAARRHWRWSRARGSSLRW